tara:strand:+ start:3206 stop:3724 length:519 start_codon:yes stop_codon:yes gene_type:complete
MSIETNDGTAKSGWQMRYVPPGYPELPPNPPSGLSAEERLTQDAMTRGMLHRELTRAQWFALVARRSINNAEVVEAINWLSHNAVTPAHHLFRLKAVTAWVMPKRADGQTSTRSLPDAFYVLHSWDNDGTPEGTLRRWKCVTDKWLNESYRDAHEAVERLLVDHCLKVGEAA